MPRLSASRCDSSVSCDPSVSCDTSGSLFLQRKRLNALLLSTAFDPNLKTLLAETDDLVTAPFFWNADVMPLCTQVITLTLALTLTLTRTLTLTLTLTLILTLTLTLTLPNPNTNSKAGLRAGEQP